MVEDLIKGNVINDSETKVKAKVAKHAIIYIYIYIYKQLNMQYKSKFRMDDLNFMVINIMVIKNLYNC